MLHTYQTDHKLNTNILLFVCFPDMAIYTNVKQSTKRCIKNPFAAVFDAETGNYKGKHRETA